MMTSYGKTRRVLDVAIVSPLFSPSEIGFRVYVISTGFCLDVLYLPFSHCGACEVECAHNAIYNVLRSSS